ncbi:uncharacterized protein DFL_004066 [Arthrobotrys flagrans]|uniref:Uncharacterized protein n=1 Tax=Arthrobotrys flagrans TaxID=97331 RepID=A0A437A3N9_ARTFL|nr:hypothetical protein DFL_004066 [Arthrobotrys flagrans]
MQPLQSCPFPSLCLALPANLRQHIRPSISQHAQHTTRFRDSTITALSPSSPAFDIHVPSVSTRLLHPSVPSVGLPVILSSQAELPVVRNEISG